MTIKRRNFHTGVKLSPTTDALTIEGELSVDSADNKLKARLNSATRSVVTEDQSQTLTNKTIDADDNTISDLEVDNLKAGVLNTSTTLAGASNTQVPSALAVKTYVDDNIQTVNEADEISYDNTTSGLAAVQVQAAIDEVDGNVDNLVTLSGVALDAVNLGTFTGTTIPDSQTNKQALQALETAHEEVDVNVNDLITLSGVAENATNLGTFTGSTIADSRNNKQALQDLETAVELRATSTVVTEIDANVDDLITLSGVAENATNLGTFTGTTIPDNQNNKQAMQALETSVETKATGAASSTDEALARFDSTTGKLLQNSVITATDAGILAGITQLNVDNLRLDGNVLSSTDTNGNVDLTPNGTGKVNANKDARFFQDVAYEITADTATGSNATLTAPPTKIIRLTGGALTSVDMIPAGSGGQQITLINATGTDVTINDNTGGTAANRILTGQKASINFKDESSLILEYDNVESRWMVTGGSGASSSAVNSSSNITNLGIAASVGASALTIALKTSSGSDPSGGSPVSVGFRNATAATGQYSTVNVTAALSLVISSGSTLGQRNSLGSYIYVYLINNAGTAELAVSRNLYDEGSIVTTVAEGGAGAADSASTIYSTTARTGVALRLIGRIFSDQTTAGTWALAPSEISLVPFQTVAISAMMCKTSSSNPGTTAATKVPWESVAGGEQCFDPLSICDLTNERLIAPKIGKYNIIINLSLANFSASNTLQVYLYKNGSAFIRYDVLSTIDSTRTFAVVSQVDVTAVGDYFEIFTSSSADSSYSIIGNTGVDSKSFFGLEYRGL